jgi:uncharacterized protein (DUF1015 family)
MRYTTHGDVTDLMAPPYDVISPERRQQLADQHPHNAVHLDLPVDEGDLDRYEAACQRLHRWLDDQVLATDADPAFYLYRMEYRTALGQPAQTTGVIGALELSTPGSADVLPHEQTTPKAKSDRLQMLRSCRSNLSPIWGLSLASGLTDLLRTDAEPDIHWTGSDAVEHRLWSVTDPEAQQAIRSAIEPHPVLIADGHHRYQTSLQYRDERRAESDTDGPYDLTMAFIVELVESQLDVRAIHRAVRVPGGAPALAAALAEWFDDVGQGRADAEVLDQMQANDALALVTADGIRLLSPKADRFAGARALDSVRLDLAMAGLEADVTFDHSLTSIHEAIGDGRIDAGVLLRPATVPQIADVSHADELMPPKTTYFHPKPSTGAVYRSLD